MLDRKILGFSLAKSKDIAYITWSEFLSMLAAYFNDVNIEITICNAIHIYVPIADRDKIFFQEHSSPLAGHKGEMKTWNRMRHKYFYENMKNDIENGIRSCSDCQLKKLVRRRTRLPMILTDTPCEIFEK